MSNGYRTLSQHLNDLKKENFSLKLRIYFLEERMQQKYEASREDIYKRVSACRPAGARAGCAPHPSARPVLARAVDQTAHLNVPDLGQAQFTSRGSQTATVGVGLCKNHRLGSWLKCRLLPRPPGNLTWSPLVTGGDAGKFAF